MTKRITLFFLAAVAAFILALPMQSFAADEGAGEPDAVAAQATDEAADDAAADAVDEAAADDSEEADLTRDEKMERSFWRRNWPILVIVALTIYGLVEVFRQPNATERITGTPRKKKEKKESDK